MSQKKDYPSDGGPLVTDDVDFDLVIQPDTRVPHGLGAVTIKTEDSRFFAGHQAYLMHSESGDEHFLVITLMEPMNITPITAKIN